MALPSIPLAQLPAPSASTEAARAELSSLLPGRVSSGSADRVAYARDMWPKALLWMQQGRLPAPPDAVAWPENAEEVRRVIELARKHRLPLTPFGAGSSVTGAAWPVRGGVSLDLKRLDRVGQVDATTHTVEVDAGVLGEPLERALNAQGFTLGHFPSSFYMSTVGGWLAARSAGQLSNKYGKIEDMTVSVRAVTGCGEVIEAHARPPRGGPSLLPLLLGSEGTLAVFTSARLRVHRVPEHRTYRGFSFPTMELGVEAIRRIFRAGLRPAVVRLYDPFDTAFVGSDKPKPPKTPPSLRGKLKSDTLPSLLRRLTPWTLGQPRLLNAATHLLRRSLLVVLFEGPTERVVDEDRAAAEVCSALGGEDLGESPGRHWYRKRYDVSFKMAPLFDDGAFVDTMEVACTWERVLPVYDAVRRALGSLAFVLCHVSHAYEEGCSLYFSLVSAASSPAATERRYDEIWSVGLAAAQKAGASVSHHHGVGLLKARALQQELGAAARWLRAVKRAFDPDEILNPGKLGL